MALSAGSRSPRADPRWPGAGWAVLVAGIAVGIGALTLDDAAPGDRQQAAFAAASARSLEQLRIIGGAVLSGTPASELPELPEACAWELRDAATGKLRDSGGEPPLLPFPTGAIGDVAEVTDGIVDLQLVRLAGVRGELVFTGGVVIEYRDIGLLAGVPRPNLRYSLRRSDGATDQPRAHALLDGVLLVLLGLWLLRSPHQRARPAPARAFRRVLLVLLVLTLSTSPFLPQAGRLTRLTPNLPWVPDATATSSVMESLVRRLVPGSTPPSFLVLGLALLVPAWWALGSMRLRGTPRRAAAALLIGLAGGSGWFLHAAARGIAATQGLMFFDPGVAVSGPHYQAVEGGLLAMGGCVAVAAAGLASLVLGRFGPRWLSLCRSIPGTLGLAALGAMVTMVTLQAAEHDRRRQVVVSLTGRDEAVQVQQLRSYLDESVAMAMADDQVLAAVERGDLGRAALLAWSTGPLADSPVPARVRVEDLESNRSLVADYDLPPGWQPEVAADTGSPRAAVASQENVAPRRWRLEISIPLTGTALVPQGTLPLLAAARWYGAPAPQRILRAHADSSGEILPGGQLPAGAKLPQRVSTGATREEFDAAHLSTDDARYLVSASRSPSNPAQLAVVAIEVLPVTESLVRSLRALLTALGWLALAAVAVGIARSARSPRPRRRFVDRFDVRVSLAAAAIALVPLAIVSWVAPAIADTARREAVERRLLAAPDIARSYLRGEPTQSTVTQLARALGLDVDLFRERELIYSSRPELAALRLVSGRAAPDAVRALEGGRALAMVHESLGALQVPSVYAWLDQRPATSGTSTPPATLFRAALPVGNADIDRATAPAIAKLQVFIFAVMVLVVGAAATVALRITAPVRALTEAADKVAGGDLDVHLSTRVPVIVGHEIAELVSSFGGMVQQLRESRAQLIAAEKAAAWEEMARQIAHEIKNPLTPMRLSVQHLQRARADNAAGFDEILARVIDTLLREIDHLGRIAEDFSDFARFPHRQLQAVDLAALVHDVATLYAETARLSCDVAPGLPPVQVDPAEMRRVLVNLVKNAIEAVAGEDSGQVVVSLARHGGEVVLRVADNGPGIPEQVRAHLFEPYFSTKSGGTGLGLAIVHRAVQAYGGRVTAADAPGGGTVFELRLPAAEPGS